MSDYQIEEKPAFTVLGIEKQLTSAYTDYAGLAAEKAAFWEAVNTNGQLAKLKQQATSDELFFANEAVDNKMMYYVGVRANTMAAGADRLIQFPAGAYVVVTGHGSEPQPASEAVIGEAFGSVLGQLSDVAYVGGPNAVAVSGSAGELTAKMLIPVVRQ